MARLALALLEDTGPAAPVVVVVGPGHNGGDGWVAARVLQRSGIRVAVWEVEPSAAPQAQVVRHEARAEGMAVFAPEPDAPPPRLIIDALLGLGARSPLSPTSAQAVRWMRAQAATGATVLAVDLPSGLNADTGSPALDEHGDPCVVWAHHTLSLLTLKPGLFTGEGRALCGRLWFDDLDTRPPQDIAPTACLSRGTSLRPAATGQRLDPRGGLRHSGHKGTHGDVWVLGGAPGMGGAAVLAARSALRAGAGRVHLTRLDGTLGDPNWPELMSAPMEQWENHSRWCNATVVAGCGGGAAIAALLPAVLHHAARLVLDADALNAVAADAQLAQRLAQRHERGRPTILTPHPLEAARLLGLSAHEVQADRLGAAGMLASRLHCTVVLKGSGSITASPGQVHWLNGSGNARLSAAGTGDVLAGWIGGAWRPDADPHELAAACVELHGQAASHTAQPDSLVLQAGRLIEEMVLQAAAAAHGQQR